MKYDKKPISSLLRLTQTIFSFNEISMVWGDTNQNTTISAVNYYVKTGQLFRIRKGFYAKDNTYDPLELATKIYTPSYISLQTVFRREGMIFQHYESIFVISYLTRTIKCDGKTIEIKKIKNEALTSTDGLINMGNYFIATKERAFLDMLYLFPRYGFDNLRSVDWDKCFELVKIYNKKTLVKTLKKYYKLYAQSK